MTQRCFVVVEYMYIGRMAIWVVQRADTDEANTLLDSAHEVIAPNGSFAFRTSGDGLALSRRGFGSDFNNLAMDEFDTGRFKKSIYDESGSSLALT